MLISGSIPKSIKYVPTHDVGGGFHFTAVGKCRFQPISILLKQKRGCHSTSFKYELVHSCNTEKFYELNGIKGGKIFAGKNTSFLSGLQMWKKHSDHFKMEDINDAIAIQTLSDFTKKQKRQV
jgi:hypothetical protein